MAVVVLEVVVIVVVDVLDVDVVVKEVAGGAAFVSVGDGYV